MFQDGYCSGAVPRASICSKFSNIIAKISLGLRPWHYPWYYSPQPHSLLSSVVYCSSISSFEDLILMSIIKSSILQKKFPKMLWILRQKSKRFRWGLATESIPDRTVLSLLILVKGGGTKTKPKGKHKIHILLNFQPFRKICFWKEL